MTFYTGPEHKKIEAMFKILKRYYITVEEVESSNAACFRHMIKELYKGLPEEYKRKEAT